MAACVFYMRLRAVYRHKLSQEFECAALDDSDFKASEKYITEYLEVLGAVEAFNFDSLFEAISHARRDDLRDHMIIVADKLADILDSSEEFKGNEIFKFSSDLKPHIDKALGNATSDHYFAKIMQDMTHLEV